MCELIASGASLSIFPNITTKVQLLCTATPPISTINMGLRKSTIGTKVILWEDIFSMCYDTSYIYVAFTNYNTRLGVFAKKFIPRGTLITEYYGSLDKNIKHPSDHRTHTLDISYKTRIIHIRGIQKPIWWCGVGSMIYSSDEPNCEFVKDKNYLRAYAKSKIDINIGEELLV